MTPAVASNGAASRHAARGNAGGSANNPVDGTPGDVGASGKGIDKRWRLVRPCALTPRQLLLSYGVVVAIGALVGAVFGWQGYWVIPLWCLFQVVMAGVVYGFYLVHAVDGEHITLSRDGQLTIDVTRGLVTQQHVLPAAWSRLERSGRNNNRLRLCCSQQWVEVGAQLRAKDRHRLERELKHCLFQALQAEPGN